MSTMERRLQLLLDQERYDRVAAESARSGRSVAAVIREAIDMRFPDLDDDRRRHAAQRLLDRTARVTDVETASPADLKKDLEDFVLAKYDGS